MADVGIAIELEDPENSPADIERITSLGTVLLVRFLELMRLSLDKNRFDHFRQFNLELNQLLQHLVHTRDFGPQLSSRPATLAALLPDDVASIRRDQERKECTVAALAKFERQKHEVLFTIGSYILEKASASDNASLRQCLNDVDLQLPANPETLAELFIRIGSPEGAQLWGRALLAHAPEGAWADSGSATYFCYLLLKLTHQYGDSQFAALRMPGDPDFVSRLRPDGPIGNAIAQFVADRERWQSLIPDGWVHVVAKVQGVFERAVAARRIAHEDEIIASSIDQTYVGEFKAQFAKGFDKYAVMRNLFRRFHAYSDSSSNGVPGKKGPKWGLSLMDFKEAYTANGHKKYFNWPDEYARNLATSESDHAFHQILQQLPDCILTDVAGLEAKIDKIGMHVQEKKIRPTAVFVARQCPLALVPNALRNFRPYWLLNSPTRNTHEFLGEMDFPERTVPVFAIWTTQDTNLGCVLQLPECITWEQLSAADNEAEAQNLEGPLYIHLVDFSSDLSARKALVATDPDWLRAQPDKDRYLSLRVWLRVQERFELKMTDPSKGIKFNLSDQGTTSILASEEKPSSAR